MRLPNSDRYSTTSIVVHWMTAMLIVGALATGFKADAAPDAAARMQFLQRHIPLAVSVLALTLGRIVWRLWFDVRPAALRTVPQWMNRAAGIVHLALYAVLLVIAATGVGTLLRSGALPLIFHGPAADLPDFDQFRAKAHHTAAVTVLVALLTLHVAAALYHQFVRRDRIFNRIWFPGKSD